MNAGSLAPRNWAAERPWEKWWRGGQMPGRQTTLKIWNNSAQIRGL